MMKWEANHGFPFLRFQKAFVFVGGGVAELANTDAICYHITKKQVFYKVVEK